MKPTLSHYFRLVFILVVALGLGAITAFPSAAQTIQVDIANDILDPNNLDDSEPSIAVNPLNPNEITIVTFSEGWGPSAPAPVWRSLDGGMTWTKQWIIPEPGAGVFGSGDQKIAYDAFGTLVMAQLGVGFDLFNYIYVQSGAPDELLTFGATFGYDQPHVEVDRSFGSAFLGRIYAPWLDFSGIRQKSTVTWTANRGLNVTNVGVGDNSTANNRTTRIAMGIDGKVYVIYKQWANPVTAGYAPTKFVVTRSDDGGVTWNANGAGGVKIHPEVTVPAPFNSSWGNPSKGKVARARSSDAWITVNNVSGDVWATYVNQDASGVGQVYVSRSTDQGVTWSSSRVSDGSLHSAFPEIAVTDNGVVGVLYIDYDDSGPSIIYRHIFAKSYDNGATWDREMLQAFDPRDTPNAFNGFIWGDYEGLAAHGNTFYGVYTGQSWGRTVSQLDPIFFRSDTVIPTISLTINPSVVSIGQSAIATVRLKDPAPTDVTITVDTDDPTHTDVQPIQIAAGETTGSTTINTFGSLFGSTTVTFTATDPTSGEQATGFLTIRPYIAGVEFLDPFLQDWVPYIPVVGGSLVEARVRLESPAPEGGVVIDLQSGNPAVAQLVPTITVQSGRDTQTFLVHTFPVANSTPVEIAALYNGSGNFGVIDVFAPAPVAVTLSPTSVTGGSKSGATVWMSGPAPPEGVTINIFSTDPAAIVPETLFIEPGKDHGTFDVNTTRVNGMVVATIVAEYEGWFAFEDLTIRNFAIQALTFNPTTVVGGGTTRGTVVLSDRAPTGGARIILTKVDPNGAITTLPKVTVPQGYSSVQFNLLTNAVLGDATASITANLEGETGGPTATITVQTNGVRSVTVYPLTMRINTTTQNAFVFLSGPAPAGGATVQLSATSGTVPATVFIPAGASQARFSYAAPAQVPSGGKATITATYPAGKSSSATITILP